MGESQMRPISGWHGERSKGTGGTSCEGVVGPVRYCEPIELQNDVKRQLKIGSPFDGGLEVWGRLVGFRVVETNL